MQRSHGASPRIKVLVANSSRMGSQLLADAIKHDRHLQVTGSVFGSEPLLEALGHEQVDVALLSSDLGENSSKNGFQALRDLSSRYPAVRAVMLLPASTREDVIEAFRCGAKGVLSKSQSLKVLCRCIRCVHAGQIWANGQELEFVLSALASATTVRYFDHEENTTLTRRERDVVRCVAEGLGNREIAIRLNLSEHTVKNYLFSIFEKLGVSSRVELLLLVFTGLSPWSDHLDRNSQSRPPNLMATWLQQAAERGCPAAQASLARMYLEGDGLPKDQVASYMWLSLAAKSSEDVLGDCISARNRLAAQLSSDQLSEGERRALDLLARMGVQTWPLVSHETVGKFAHPAHLGCRKHHR